ncbi:hypothetical protein B0H63DRAFT_468480 [Podospora didyma]|uniref:Uncharacterized protein n=1 Tax=Podospora didyma TaxID=330526 RepID=A0AAE0NSG4_9PEZI|nr:hypothetical protein B0H63DRAFT_468480 [Podospora didyma]
MQLTASALLLIRTEKRDSTSGGRFVPRLIELSNHIEDTPLHILEEILPAGPGSGRGKLFMNVITVAAMATVLTKLGALTVPFHIYLWAWLMVSGWLAVQTLLFLDLSHKLVTLDERQPLINNLCAAARDLSNVNLYILTLAAFAPVFCYLGYNFNTWLAALLSPLHASGFYKYVLLPLSVLVVEMLWIFGPTILLGVLLLPCSSLFDSVFVWVLAGSVLSFPIGVMMLLFDRVNMWVRERYEGIVWSALSTCVSVCVWAVWAYIWMLASLHNRGREMAGGFVIINVFIAAIVFAVVLFIYDPIGTSRPNWTEWLG